jgi:nicotinate-nucleotide pyrophosphorylase (carboxylating)
MFTSELIRRAIEEDASPSDITSEALVPESLRGRGVFLAKQDLVVAGLGVACGVFLSIDPGVLLRPLVRDGDGVSPPQEILEVEGSYRDLLKGERTALNFLQRLCGIATLTRAYVRETEGTKTQILDTRKTLPLHRSIEKHAVRMGGGSNHRMGLFDAILIKDNHLAACRGDVGEAVARARKRHPGKPVTVEIVSVSDVEAAISSGASRLLLDNMGEDEIRASITAVAGRAEVEISGGVTLERVRRLSSLGADFISVGAITHSAPSVDLSFEITPS